VLSFRRACLAYLGVALPGSTLGLLWPSMRVTLHQPVSALGIVIASSVAAEVVSSALTGRLLTRVRAGLVLAAATGLSAVALAAEAAAPSLLVFAVAAAAFGIAFGTLDSALNAHAARHFGPRQINWMHAAYGLGATAGPLLVTGLLGAGLSWRWSFAMMAIVLGILATVFAAGTIFAASTAGAAAPAASTGRDDASLSPAEPARRPAGARGRTAVTLGALTFAAVESGIESGAGIWGYVFLTAGRGLPPAAAGVAVAGYWATMFAGRAILGPVAERAGARRVLAVAVAGVAAGAVLMSLPGPGPLAVAGLLLLGLAAAPVFPLLTLGTAERAGLAGAAGTTQLVGLQVAASAVGSAVLPAGLGLAIGSSPRVLAPALLALSLAMCGLHALLAAGARSPIVNQDTTG
jgi:fucose permease